MDPDQVEIIMNECCDEEDEDGCIPYESRFKLKSKIYSIRNFPNFYSIYIA